MTEFTNRKNYEERTRSTTKATFAHGSRRAHSRIPTIINTIPISKIREEMKVYKEIKSEGLIVNLTYALISG